VNTQLQQLFAKFDALNERERLAVLLLLVVAIFIFFVELLISPLNQRYKQIVSLQTQTKQLESQVAILKSKKTRDPDFQEKQKIKLLNEQISNIDVRLKEKMHGLIEPKQMAKVLEVVLAQNTDLKLQRVQSLGAKPLSPLKVNEAEKAEPLGIYQHGMQIEFKGSYLSTLKYLKALDKLPWNFYWDVLELNVNKYPVSTIVITVHTLSFHEGWIGV
jgi:MSHA biogenesis protein MshJ